jgi:hypothetical protein
LRPSPSRSRPPGRRRGTPSPCPGGGGFLLARIPAAPGPLG